MTDFLHPYEPNSRVEELHKARRASVGVFSCVAVLVDVLRLNLSIIADTSTLYTSLPVSYPSLMALLEHRRKIRLLIALGDILSHVEEMQK